jgi:hypothetical protein
VPCCNGRYQYCNYASNVVSVAIDVASTALDVAKQYRAAIYFASAAIAIDVASTVFDVAVTTISIPSPMLLSMFCDERHLHCNRTKPQCIFRNRRKNYESTTKCLHLN